MVCDLSVVRHPRCRYLRAGPELHEQLQSLTKMAQIARCAGVRPGPVTSVGAATKHTLRSITRRWQLLNDEIKTHEALLGEFTSQLVPQLVDAFGTARTLPRRSSSSPATTSTESVPNRPGPNSAASHRSQHPPAWPTGTDSSVAGTARPTPPSIEPSSSVYNTTNPPAPTSLDAPPRVRRKPRSSAA